MRRSWSHSNCIAAAWLAIVAMAGACSPLSVYNALSPADAAALPAALDLAYGRDKRQRLDVYIPAIKPKSAPIVVFFYGGSWSSGRKQDYEFVGKALASRGFVTIVADYRLVPAVRFPDFLDECALATLWAYTNAAKYGGDPSRLFLLGHSAGAYNAAMVALDGRYLEALGSRTSIIRGAALLAGPYDFLPLDVSATIAAFGQAKALPETQPITFASAAAPPMFLATGADDTTVKPRNTRALADSLQAGGRPATVRTYPGVGHVSILLALSLPFRAKAPVLDDIAAFIASSN